MADVPVLTFGMYRGRRLDDVPQDYVRWLAHPARQKPVRRHDKTYKPLDEGIVTAARALLMEIEKRHEREDFASILMSGAPTGRDAPLYVIDADGDCESRSGSHAVDGRCFHTLHSALAYLASEYPIDDPEDLGRGVISGRSTPDPEDDRILIWEVLPTGHRKVVWGFFGWHWSADAYACGQGTLPGDADPLHAIASRD